MSPSRCAQTETSSVHTTMADGGSKKMLIGLFVGMGVLLAAFFVWRKVNPKSPTNAQTAQDPQQMTQDQYNAAVAHHENAQQAAAGQQQTEGFDQAVGAQQQSMMMAGQQPQQPNEGAYMQQQQQQAGPPAPPGAPMMPGMGQAVSSSMMGYQ